MYRKLVMMHADLYRIMLDDIAFHLYSGKIATYYVIQCYGVSLNVFCCVSVRMLLCLGTLQPVWSMV